MRTVAEQIWLEAGWSERLPWPVPGRTDPELIFSLRLPLGWELERPRLGGRPGTPSERLREWGRSAFAVALIPLVMRVHGEGGDELPVYATLSVSLAALEGPEQPPAGDVVARVGAGEQGGWEARSVKRVPLPAGGAASVLVVQYLLRTEYGALAITGSAPQAIFHEPLSELFRAVVQTVRLDPASL